MRRSLILSSMALLALAGVAQADVLWNQLPAYDDPAVASFPDRITTDPFSGASGIFCDSDVTVPAGGWTVQSVTTYFSDLSFNPTVTSAVLNIFPKTGALPVAANDPRAMPTGQGTTVVPVDVRSTGGASVQPVMILTADGLNINLPAGEYWIGLTPTLQSGPFGSDLHWGAATMIGAPSAARGYDAFGGFPWTDVGSLAQTSPFDLAITINGVVPAPSSLALMGLAGLAAARRRR